VKSLFPPVSVIRRLGCSIIAGSATESSKNRANNSIEWVLSPSWRHLNLLDNSPNWAIIKAEMKQNKIIIVAVDNDNVFQLIGKALANHAESQPIVRVTSATELGSMLSSGQKVSGIVPDAAHILIVDELLLQCQPDPAPWAATTNSGTRMLIIVLIDRDDQKTINKYQGLGANMCILKSQVESELSQTLTMLGDFLAVVQAPQV
jgi:hypothetical protein